MSDAGLKLREATSEDSQKLNNFFMSIPTHGAIEIKIGREQHFFSFYQRLGLTYKTYILEDGIEILGTASFLMRELKFKNRTLLLAQACDLRISPNRRAVLSWSNFFHPLLEEVRMNEKCDGFITSINQTESQAMNAFIRPKLKRAHQPLYSLARSYNLVSVHGFYPWAARANRNITVRPFKSSDKENLLAHLKAFSSHFDFLPVEAHDDLADFINRSLLYSWSQFLIAFDADDKIIGCVQPISSSLLQDYFPQEYDPQAHNFRQFLKVTQWLRFGRRLTKPFSRTQKQEALHFRLLHFLSAAHPEVLKALIKASYDTSKQNEFLIYAYEKNDFRKRPPRGSIFAEIPYGLYSIETDGRDILPELSLLNSRSAWLDFIWF
ncbi:MAG: hypothetical protein H7061_09155 [Bdellovibrionaceae bacterium]|nr:hypothetical protein [Bdellovibrio sp.]